MRNIIPVNKNLIILRIQVYLVLEHLSLNRHIIFPEHFKKVLEEKTAYSSKSLNLTNRPVLEENSLHISIQE